MPSFFSVLLLIILDLLLIQTIVGRNIEEASVSFEETTLLPSSAVQEHPPTPANGQVHRRRSGCDLNGPCNPCLPAGIGRDCNLKRNDQCCPGTICCAFYSEWGTFNNWANFKYQCRSRCFKISH